jgi:ubiquinone/menaquinone biosynthesis C-methylase UbiE
MGRFFLADYYRKLHSEEKKYGKPAGPERVEVIRVIPETLVKEAYRILKKGGFFLGTVPNAFRIKTHIFEKRSEFTRRKSFAKIDHFICISETAGKNLEFEGNYKELAKHLYEILTDEPMQQTIAIKSRQRAEQIFDNKKNSLKILSILEKVANRNN